MHVPQHELRRYLLYQVDKKRIREIDSHLVNCAPCVQKLMGGVASFARPSRLVFERLEQERASGDPGSLQPLNPFSTKQCEAWLIDVTRTGVKVMVDDGIDPKALVRLRFKELILFGVVRYVVQYYDFESGPYYPLLKILGAADSKF